MARTTNRQPVYSDSSFSAAAFQPPPRPFSFGNSDLANSSIPVSPSRKVEKAEKVEPRPATNDEANRCLEAMRALSPPRSDSPNAGNSDASAREAARLRQYTAWMEEYPSALENFDELVKSADGKRIALFLDYDGTLSPIVEDPERAFMSDEMRAAVNDAAELFPTAIISGRSRQKVYGFVQLPQLYYAGSHGMDIMGPAEGVKGTKVSGTMSKGQEGQDVVLCQPGLRFEAMMEELCKALEEKCRGIAGANVENNKFCITMHFRRVKEESWKELAGHVESTVRNYPDLRLTQGRKVLEVRPSIQWNKGKAVDFLLRAFEMEGMDDSFAVYIGDDGTDEDAFAVLRDKDIGLGILVSKHVKPTKAKYTLKDPAEVMMFLQSLVQWKANRLR